MSTKSMVLPLSSRRSLMVSRSPGLMAGGCGGALVRRQNGRPVSRISTRAPNPGILPAAPGGLFSRNCSATAFGSPSRRDLAPAVVAGSFPLESCHAGTGRFRFAQPSSPDRLFRLHCTGEGMDDMEIRKLTHKTCREGSLICFHPIAPRWAGAFGNHRGPHAYQKV